MSNHRRVRFNPALAHGVEAALAESGASAPDRRLRLLAALLALAALITAMGVWRHRRVAPPVPTEAGFARAPVASPSAKSETIVMPKLPPEEVLAVDEQSLGIPFYPGAVPTVVTRDSSREHGKRNLLNVMATSRDRAENVEAYFRKRMGGGLKVRRVDGAGARVAVMEGRKGDRRIRVTLSPGAGRGGPGTVITITSEQI